LLPANLRFPLFTRSKRNGKPGNWFSGGLLWIDLLWMVLIALSCPRGRAETFKAPDPGRGGMAITGRWQFHTGDNLAWANPAFDDSGWQAISGDRPWGAQGHPGYRGYAWYRKRIEIGPGGTPLGVWIWYASGAYEVYWNGKEVGESGSLPPHARWYVYGQDVVYDLRSSGPVSGVLALRFWLPPATTASDSGEGGLAYRQAIGSLQVLQITQQGAFDRYAQSKLPGVIASSLILTAGLLSVVLFLRKPRQWLYLWVAMLMFGKAPVGFEFLSAPKVPFIANQFLGQSTVALSGVGLWLLLLSVFGLSRSRRWRVVTAIVIAVYLVAHLIDCICFVFWQHAGPGMIRTDRVTTQIFTALGFYVLVLVGFGLARSRTWSLVPLGVIAVLRGLDNPLFDLFTLINPAAANAVPYWALHLGSYSIDAASILDGLLLATLMVTVVQLQIREARRQTHLEAEIRSAQEVQQVLIPAEVPSIPGLAVTSVYKPAAEVGGDFFQIIPPGPDGREPGTLIVVGDVSGKGLKAAMTVSLIVGAVRTLAESTRNPAAILAGLNRRLLGRTQGGFATCLILRIDADGNAAMANAGHLPPYRNGTEWELPPSLPLGLSPYAEYDETRLYLEEAETLTILTDGVLEARNDKGELYGFERLAGLMHGRPTAEQVAEAACSFGQEDDITVLSVSREATCEPLPSMMLQPVRVAG
jgi:hypothetical protein